MTETHSISGRIVVEGRQVQGGAVVWVDSLHMAETDSLGDYAMAGFDDGTHIVMAWSEHCLARLVDSVQVSGNDVAGVDDTLFAGDIVDDGRINLLDAGEVLQHLHATPGSGSWDESLDLDRSGVIDSLDIAALIRHWKDTEAVAPPSRIVVTEPTGVTFWTLGQHDVSISWQTGGLQGTVSIVLYRGGSPVGTIAGAAPNSGSFNGYNVPVDLIPGTDYRVEVRFNGIIHDYSDFFEIKTAIFVTLPNSSTVWARGQQDVLIHWTTGSLGGVVSISIYKGNSLIQDIASSTPNNGVYTAYDVPESLVPGEDYRIGVFHLESRVFGSSDYFEVRRSIVVTEPASSTIWNRGQKSVPVTWITGTLSGYVSINLYKGISQLRQLSRGYPNNGTQRVDVPTDIPLGADYRIQVYLDADHNDLSDYFMIQDSLLVITAPDTNTVWLRGQENVTIGWKSSFMTESVSISLYQGDNLVEMIASSIPNDGEYSQYSVPAGLAPGIDYRIRIDFNNAGKHALSQHFEIAKPSGWVWLFPSIQGYHLASVCFTDASTGTAVGEYGTILRTMDGGATWVRQWSSTRRQLRGVAFHDANMGLAVGDGGVILKTTDGGATWVGKVSGYDGVFYSVSFADADTAVAAGGRGDGIAFCRSTDGGETWTTSRISTYTIPKSVSFFNAKIGAAAADAGAVWWTTDGGATWNIRGLGPGPWGDYMDKGTGISVLDANTWVVAGWHYYDTVFYGWKYQGVIYLTRDAGVTWSKQWSGGLLNSVSFADANTGIAVGESGVILKTTDGGVTWVQQTSGISNSLAGVSFTDANNGTAVGAYGGILRTTNGGATWVPQTLSTPVPLRGISFADANAGLVVGGSETFGIVLRTTDGGATWLPQATPGGVLNDISMANADTGTAVGGYYSSGGDVPPSIFGVVLRTTDGGATWVRQNGSRTLSRTLFNGGFFTAPNTGTIFGIFEYETWQDSCVVLRTQNGGSTWVPHAIGYCFEDVWFFDANTGTAVGAGGAIHRTVDGGATWIQQTSGTSNYLASVHFTDANTGTAVGIKGTILRTLDGGATWIQQTSGTNNGLLGVRFVDATTGMAVGLKGTVLRTTDGGATWTRQDCGTTRDLYAVYFFDANTGIVVGEGGTILGTTTGGE